VGQRTELRIGLHLAWAGAPVAGPSAELPARVHRYEQHALTFWRYHEHDAAAVIDAAEAGRVLADCHRALDTYPWLLPSFLSRQVSRAGRLLANSAELSALPAPERALLRHLHARLTSSVASRRPPVRVLHGDPHRGNLLVSACGIMMIDFESACTGPLEWDLSALPGGGAGVFPDIDHELLAVLRQLRSLCVAVWCWQRPGQTPEIDRAARLHLNLLTQPGIGRP
jgi:Phosphotransferase enzyme family